MGCQAISKLLSARAASLSRNALASSPTVRLKRLWKFRPLNHLTIAACASRGGGRSPARARSFVIVESRRTVPATTGEALALSPGRWRH
jgi:hypothetical protein